MSTREEGEVADRPWLIAVPWIAGLIVLGLMGWGFFKGVTSLIETARPEEPGDASIALSAGFVSPRPAATAPAESLAQAAPAPQTMVVTSSSPPGPEAAGTETPGAGVGAPTPVEPLTKEKPKAKKEPPPVFEIQGSVQSKGQPVSKGKVRLTVSLVGERFRQSTLADLDDNGNFVIHDHPTFRLLTPRSRIRVLAEVWPASARTTSPLTETIYLNHHLPSWIRSSTGYVLLLGVVLFSALFLWAFTGDCTYAKNRLAIVLSYSMIFISLAGALVGPTLLMLAVPDLPEISGKVPVGLVVARLTETSNPEWMLNIGGYVATNEPAKTGLFQGSGGDGAGSGVAEGMATPVLRVVTLNGGIQIPLYVILLALIGGAINMTRQVPDFQSRQPGNRSRLLQRMRFSARPAPREEAREEDDRADNNWRKGLLEQYMFLVAAPFLAIATYYLLILLGTIQPPIIVLVCFSIGLISDTVVTAITEAAKKLLGGKPAKDQAAHPRAAERAEPPAPPQVEPAPIPQTRAETGAEDATHTKKVA